MRTVAVFLGICHTEEAAALLQAVPDRVCDGPTLAGVQQDPQDSLAQLAGLVGLPALLAGLLPLDHRARQQLPGFRRLCDQGGAAFVGGSGGQGLPPVFSINRLCPRHAGLLLLTPLQPHRHSVPELRRLVTPVDDVVAVATTQVLRPEYITLTETKSDFRLALRTSVTHVTLTHTSYAITHVPSPSPPQKLSK
ncbi:hypothetical protein GWK47_007245 [Chionoecetes opilio]|uniref:Uncharacterized protein n=1 Tax=Chionoecetes opilio TaxID=41210 RepID=A0A8J4Y2U9_CHIOP|nr:hypothetical protein GWK47_007245 [Chionoecetes opilio]